MMPTGIYIHIPFCAKKCPYCDFYSCSYSKSMAEQFTDALIKEIENFKGGVSADTVYFGGGTPSLIPAEFTEKILSAVKNRFELLNPEITLEVNPCTVNYEKLMKYREMGINRLSTGVQSMNDNELKLLGRSHTAEKAVQVILDAEKCGFENISADVMIGLPGQNCKTLENTIQKLSELPLTHISSYILKIEEGTPFDNEEFIRSMPDDDFVSDMYLCMVKSLSEKGFKQYEISNFSKPGFESRHNLKYWRCMEYIGFGCSAHSFYDGRRFYCTDNLDSYIKNGAEKVITDESPAGDDEKIMLGLRLSEGININDYPERKDDIIKKSELLKKAGYVNFDGRILSLTPKGFLVSNMIINEVCEK